MSQVRVCRFARVVAGVSPLDVGDGEAGSKVTQSHGLCLRVDRPQVTAILEPGNSDRKFSRKDGTNDRRPHPLPQVSSEQKGIDHRLFCSHTILTSFPRPHVQRERVPRGRKRRRRGKVGESFAVRQILCSLMHAVSHATRDTETQRTRDLVGV